MRCSLGKRERGREHVCIDTVNLRLTAVSGVVSTTASARMEKRPSVSPRMSSESSLTAFDPEVVALAERAAETGCSEASSASLVSSIEVGPGIDFSAGDAAHGVLPLVAERTPSLSYQFGLVAPLGGRHHWEALPSHLSKHYIKSLTLLYPISIPCTARAKTLAPSALSSFILSVGSESP